LVEAVRRVAVVAERNTPVRLSFTGGQLSLDAGTGEVINNTPIMMEAIPPMSGIHHKLLSCS
jgi:hypothetical protein